MILHWRPPFFMSSRILNLIKLKLVKKTSVSKCTKCKRNESVAVSDDTIEAGGLVHLFEKKTNKKLLLKRIKI